MMRGILIAAAVVFVTACQAPVTQTEKQELAAPVNCATAKSDLATLQSEKTKVGKQVLEGVSAFSPIGLVTGVATGTEKEKAQVASGEYNKMIDQKIAEIKTTCGIQ
jgi:hypothetical protein